MRDLVPYMQPFAVWPVTLSTAVIVGFLQGFGAMFGDIVKSAIKRSWLARIPAGQPWQPWDQVDFVLGTLLMFALASLTNTISFPPVVIEGMLVFVWLAVFSAVAIPWANQCFYYFGWKSAPH